MKIPEHHNQPIDYSLKEGLDIDVTRFNRNAASKEHTLHLDRSELLALPNAGDDPERDQAVAEQAKHRIIVAHIGGAAVEMMIVGPDDAEAVELHGNGYGGNIRSKGLLHALQIRAASDPNRQRIVFNRFGTGRSRATPAIEKEMKRGNFSPTGEVLAAAVQDYTDGKDTHVRAYSAGSRDLLAALPAINQGKGVKTAYTFDPPGAESLHPGQMGMRYIYQEQLRRFGSYRENALDPRVMDALSAPFDETEDASKWRELRQMLLIDPIALGKETLESELHEAFPYVTDELRLYLPSESAIANVRAVADIMQRVRDESTNPATLEAWVIKRHAHQLPVVAPTIEARLFDERRMPSPFDR